VRWHPVVAVGSKLNEVRRLVDRVVGCASTVVFVEPEGKLVAFFASTDEPVLAGKRAPRSGA
jgi:hypothetical protein